MSSTTGTTTRDAVRSAGSYASAGERREVQLIAAGERFVVIDQGPAEVLLVDAELPSEAEAEAVAADYLGQCREYGHPMVSHPYEGQMVAEAEGVLFL